MKAEKKGVRICEQNNSADPKVSEGEQGGASGTRAEVPLVRGADSCGEAAHGGPWGSRDPPQVPVCGTHRGAGEYAQRSL